LFRTHSGVQRTIEHFAHPMIRFDPQRFLQGYSSERTIAAGVCRECKQHKRFDPPRWGQRSGQQRPERLGGSGVDTHC
jgi:hypothetical protein